MTREEYVKLFKECHDEILINMYGVTFPVDFYAEELVDRLIELGILKEDK